MMVQKNARFVTAAAITTLLFLLGVGSSLARLNEPLVGASDEEVTASARLNEPLVGARDEEVMASPRFLAESDNPTHYGNWCGFGNTQNDRNYPCKDDVDCACRGHDLCLNDAGYHRCGCDADFMKDLRDASCSDDEDCESYRKAALAVFRIKPCQCRKRRCTFGYCREVSSYGMGGKPNC